MRRASLSLRHVGCEGSLCLFLSRLFRKLALTSLRGVVPGTGLSRVVCIEWRVRQASKVLVRSGNVISKV